MVSKRFDKIVLSIFIFLIFAFSAFMLTNSVVSNAKADTDSSTNISTGSDSRTYEDMSHAAAQFFGACCGYGDWETLRNIGYPGQDDGELAFNNNSEDIGAMVSYVGGLLGYIDPDSYETLGSSGILAGNATVYNREFLSKFKVTESGTTTYPLLEYQAYGQVLHDLGLDETTFGGSANNDSVRKLVGWLYKFAYLASIMLTVFFNLIFAILGSANPFKLFEGVESRLPAGSTNVSVSVSNGVVGSILDDIDTGISSLKDFVGHFYVTLKGMSLAVILPLMFVITLFILLVWKRTLSGGEVVKTFKNYLIRLTFVVLGLPLMFACYSTAIELMGDFTVAKNAVATKVVLSTFCDFEGWAKHNLCVEPLVNSVAGNEDYVSSSAPESEKVIATNVDTGVVSAKSMDAVRTMCASINCHTLGYTNFSGSIGVNSELYHTNLLDPSNTDEMYNAGGDSIVSDVLGLLETYGSGSVFSAADYSMYRDSGAIPSCSAITNHWSYIHDYASDSVSDDIFRKHVVLSEVSTHREGFDPDEVDRFYRDNGSTVIDMEKNDVITLVTNRFNLAKTGGSGTAAYYATRTYPSIWNDGNLRGIHCGLDDDFLSISVGAVKDRGYGCLSTMSMYNYLCSVFENGSVSVYAANKSGSVTNKPDHYSVTCIGTGLMEFIFILDGLMLLASVVVIGYLYGFAMLMSNFKAIFKIIPGVLSGMLGFMQGIASVVLITATLIIEIIGTCLIYSIACELLYLVYELTEVPVRILFKDLGLANVVGEASTMLLGILSIFLTYQFIVYALRYRRAIVTAATEATANAVNNFLGTNVVAPNLSEPADNIADKAKSAVMAAAGLGMAASAMDKNGELAGYKNSFAEALGIDSKSDGSKLVATGDDEDSKNLYNGTVSENNPYGIKTTDGGVVEDEFTETTGGKTETEGSDNTADSNNENSDDESADNNGKPAETPEASDQNTPSAEESTTGSDNSGNGTVAASDNNTDDKSGGKVSLQKPSKKPVNGQSDDAEVEINENSEDENIIDEAEAEADAAKNEQADNTPSDLVDPDKPTSETAEDYIERNQDAFLASIDGDGTVTKADSKTGEIIVTNPETGEQSVIDPDTGKVSVVDPKTGKKVPVENVRYDSTTGQLIATDLVTNEESVVGSIETDASTGELIQVDSKSGSSTDVKFTQDGTVNLTTDSTVQADSDSQIADDDSQASTPAMVMTATDGSKIDGYHMVNTQTCEAYTEADYANNVPYSIVDSQGNAYVGEGGVEYSNMPATTYQTSPDGAGIIVNPSNHSTMMVSNGLSNVTETETVSTTNSSGGMPQVGGVVSGTADISSNNIPAPSGATPFVAYIPGASGAKVPTGGYPSQPAVAAAAISGGNYNYNGVIPAGGNNVYAVATGGAPVAPAGAVVSDNKPVEDVVTVNSTAVNTVEAGSTTTTATTTTTTTSATTTVTMGSGSDGIATDITGGGFVNTGGSGSDVVPVLDTPTSTGTDTVVTGGSIPQVDGGQGDVIVNNVYNGSTEGSNGTGDVVINVEENNAMAVDTQSSSVEYSAGGTDIKPEIAVTPDVETESEDEESDDDGESLLAGAAGEILGSLRSEAKRSEANKKNGN